MSVHAIFAAMLAIVIGRVRTKHTEACDRNLSELMGPLTYFLAILETVKLLLDNAHISGVPWALKLVMCIRDELESVMDALSSSQSLQTLSQVSSLLSAVSMTHNAITALSAYYEHTSHEDAAYQSARAINSLASALTKL